MTESIVNDSQEENWQALPAVPTRVRSVQMKACLACRRVKMKCRLQSGETSCARCAQKSIECIVLEHRRGRKPGTRIARKSGLGDNDKGTPKSAMAPRNGTAEQYVTQPARFETYSKPQFSAETSGLQPSELLNHEAMRGKFSMQRILDTQLGRVENAMPERPFAQPTQDAIEIGLVSQSIAEHLFRSFMDILNPYISQLDSDLHTFSYVRQKSPFLLGSILAVSSKMFNPSLYKRLYQYAEDLFLENFRAGYKSTETVQAILMFTYWKEPEDTRSWVNLGYAIRICMDLGWHKLNPQAIRGRSGMDELELREARNIERTWFLLFVYDRSLSLQTGKPWMIERSGFIESIEHWSKERTATANDTLLAAFVTLRLLTSEVFKLLSPCRHVSSFENIKSFLTIIGNRIDEWEDKWIQACGDGRIRPSTQQLILLTG
ncbi:hypothetical protein ZTR_06420 [Talaromyces verruculosus]|nr:hypothetical protein ZTR_06420 [Talaromyces verruculosus]